MAQGVAFGTRDHDEGASAFVEGRSPDFEGPVSSEKVLPLRSGINSKQERKKEGYSAQSNIHVN